jgi:hypothetical protein
MMSLLLAAVMIAGIARAQEGTDDPGRLVLRDARSFPWHGEKRVLHYRPDGEDFVCVHADHRFNRALYGTNTAFRVEAGDLPEFALYMPGMGGNWRFGIARGDRSEWLASAKKVKAIYRPGSMVYEVRDSLLGNGVLYIRVLALSDAEGMVIELKVAGVDKKTRFFCTYGGASGKKFSRDGDLGADPESSFDCKPEYCRGNSYAIDNNLFRLGYGKDKSLDGRLPPAAVIRVADAGAQGTPLALWNAGGNADANAVGKVKDSAKTEPVMVAEFTGTVRDGSPLYFVVVNPASQADRAGRAEGGAGAARDIDLRDDADRLFANAEKKRQELAGRVTVHTPDSFINTLGGALAVAGDAIWESPSYLHGAVAWRIRLPGWRGPYVADPLGWHDRARTHFSSYALSQVLSPETGPVVADTNLHLARQQEKLGTSLFSEGYICRNPGGDLRPNHYDMNLVYIDELLDHFLWTGDTGYVRKMWPVLQRHLAWEKRNFDVDGDGLYDAYCCIWASDALQYSGGGVTHSSAYNYRANRIAAELAVLIREDPKPYQAEATKILRAINAKLWMPTKGWYAEYIDRLGRQHPSAGLWTVYHSIDSDVPDPFQAWQTLRYIDTDIPHIPIRADGLHDNDLYTISTTNWQPYTWSINNVVLAECLHTALACWQAGRQEQAWPIWKGALMESMYLGGSPGNFQQLSFYDAARGELYRDFADPIGMAARSLVEGLFGIHPDALHDTLVIHPGWPAEWNKASLHIPDIDLDFHRTGNEEIYAIESHFPRGMKLVMELRAAPGSDPLIKSNGTPVAWMPVQHAIGHPMIRLVLPGVSDGKPVEVRIAWRIRPGSPRTGRGEEEPGNGGEIHESLMHEPVAEGSTWKAAWQDAIIGSVYDPQQALDSVRATAHELSARVRPGTGNKTIFLALRRGTMQWWLPVYLLVTEPVTMDTMDTMDKMATVKGLQQIMMSRKTTGPLKGVLEINEDVRHIVDWGSSKDVTLLLAYSETRPGTNLLRFINDGTVLGEYRFTDWRITPATGQRYEKVDLSIFFNDRVTNLFRNKYLSPRPAVPTLQLPEQGIGNWCYPLVTADIDDAGLRRAAGEHDEIRLPQGVPFQTPGTGGKNILFTSAWDNYPDSAVIPLGGQARHAYFLMAGSTDPMQSHITNGVIEIRYKDGTVDSLPLVNPENWWPIEQDYYVDGYAFTIGGSRPIRISLKTGEPFGWQPGRATIKGFTNMAIPGGAATVLDMPLNPHKKLDRLVLRTEAEDVVIGLMSMTLLRN